MLVIILLNLELEKLTKEIRLILRDAIPSEVDQYKVLRLFETF